ncbi:MAG: DUF1460 domain-containing protein [Gemmatimonadota bacterium]|nr:DUF1460 domain-containing protein [Gemmatimonadota bacterium]MDH5760044.1 DUF1460 domain-containing protein [Gemmatimonadota bacterium]
MRREILVVGWAFLSACGVPAGDAAVRSDAAGEDGPLSEATERPTPEGHAAPTKVWSDLDWDAFSSRVRWALDQGLDTVPLGEAMVRMGRTFVGTPYVPGTLEAEGPEHLVIDFQGLDCVTLVENVLALARFARSAEAATLLGDRPAAQRAYEKELEALRYRNGHLDGYPSRLHYFTDWIADHEARGMVRNVVAELGGVRDTESVDFMSTHVGAYRQLADPGNLAAIQAAEGRITAMERWFVPQDRIAAIAHSIHDGDIIAATSTVGGLDIAHTGLALWVDGELHLLHAPLVGSAVEVSELPLARRILGISSQDGIVVARPVED